jgi:hypothetical protein
MSDAISVFSTSWRTRLVVSKSAKELQRVLTNWYLGLVWGWEINDVAREGALSPAVQSLEPELEQLLGEITEVFTAAYGICSSRSTISSMTTSLLLRANRRNVYYMTAVVRGGTPSVSKIALPDQGGPNVVDYLKAHGHQPCMKRGSIIVAPEGLPNRCDARGERFSGGAVIVRRLRVSVVKGDVGTTWKASDKAESRKECLLRQIRYDTQPREEGGLRRIKYGGGKSIR